MFKKIFSLFRKQEVVKASSIGNYQGYLINDPSTPEIVENTIIPNSSLLKYNVKNLNLNSNPTSKAEQQSLNCHITIGNCINYVQQFSKNPIKNWSSTSCLVVFPQAGQDLNAYYDRLSLRFFYYKSRGKIMFTSDSSDVVSHELGHALLDAIRPDFWSVQSLEVWSFHEGFSDIVALVSVMQYDSIIQKALNETNNDLSKSNSISKLAEEFGILVYNLTRKKGQSYLSNCLRDPAIEKFKYSDPAFLPAETKNDQLAAESHSFGRVFSAVWYNIFVEIYKKELEKSKNPILAVKNSRDICFSLLLQAIPISPLVSEYYSAIAKSMVAVAKSKKCEYAALIEKCFVDWNIIKPIKIMSNIKWQDIVGDLKNEDEVIKNDKITIVKITNKKLIKLNNISILSNKKILNDVEIEIPADKYFEFDSKGNLIDEINEKDEESIRSANFCLKSVEKSLGRMWSIQDGKLIRSYIE